MLKKLITGALLLIGAPAFSSPMISEFMADNRRSSIDDDDDRSDWIEIYNPGGTPANLRGWFLTDDPDHELKWEFQCEGFLHHADDQRSPVFIQWLDCIWQIWNQNPSAFEFNEAFLSFLADSLYSCKYGTFLYDCERQRTEANSPAQTISVWAEALRKEHINSGYKATLSRVSLAPRCLCWMGESSRRCFEPTCIQVHRSALRWPVASRHIDKHTLYNATYKSTT